MNREKVTKETKKWTAKGIITENQADEIIAQYPKRDRSSILLSFAGLFIGLGFLTFIASNWSLISNVAKMIILLIAMVIFYLAGYYIYKKKSVQTGVSFLLIGLMIFGAGIFLTGQMYNYIFFSALPFFIWALAGTALYAMYRHSAIFVVSLSILTIGQIYSGMVYAQFDWKLALLLLFGFSHFTYHHARPLYGYLLAVSYTLSALVWSFTNEQPYYWLIVCFLILYLAGDLLRHTSLRQPLWMISLSSGFLLTLFQVFFMTGAYLSQGIDRGWFFLLIWAIIAAVSFAIKIKNADAEHFLDYTLFLPVIYLGTVDLLSLILLFVFSIGWLLIGYRRDKQEQIAVGTISFLVSTISAYSHFAWDFLDKSLFFFIGGILLFVLSFLLEQKRRNWRTRETGGLE